MFNMSYLRDIIFDGVYCLSSLASHCIFRGKFAGFTECRKQFLDFKRLSAGIFQCKEWASFVSWLAFSTDISLLLLYALKG